MVEVTSREFQRAIGAYQAKARKEPVVITNHGRKELVMLDFDEYNRLKRRDRQVGTIQEITEEHYQDIVNGRGEAPADLDKLMID